MTQTLKFATTSEQVRLSYMSSDRCYDLHRWIVINRTLVIVVIAIIANNLLHAASIETHTTHQDAIDPASIEPRPRFLWPTVDLLRPVDNLLVDTRDGSVYASVESAIFKFGRDLNPLIKTSADSKALTAASSNSTNDNQTHRNKLLLLIPRSNNIDLLLACWQANTTLILRCVLTRTNDLKSSPVAWPNGSRGFWVDPADEVRAIIDGSTKSILLASTKVDNKPNDLQAKLQSIHATRLPAICRMQIVPKAKQILMLDFTAVLPYNENLNQHKLYYEYVSTFDYNNHTHFILNDIRKPISSMTSSARDITVKIARICKNDPGLTSYTEISIKCSNYVNLDAKYAYVQATTLYIAYETSSDETSTVGHQSSKRKSILCTYNMNLVKDIFDSVVDRCQNADPRSTLLAKLHNSSEPVPLCHSNPTRREDWCTSATNPYIDGTSSFVNDDTSIDLGPLYPINFVYNLKQGPNAKDVLFVGTKTGILTKMSLDEEVFFALDLFDGQIKNYHIGDKLRLKPPTVVASDGSEAQMTTLYSAYNRTIIASTNAGIISKIDMDACSYYTSCKSCLNTRDPLQCMWCGSSCNNKAKCPTGAENPWVGLSCPPVITNFVPRSGPLSGSTQMTVYGDNFGVRGNLSVVLGDSRCIVNESTRTNEMIECSTIAVDSPKNVSLQLSVDDESQYIYSKGTWTTMEQYRFVAVQVYGLSPERGAERTNVTVRGLNLDAGVTRSIRIETVESATINDQVRCDIFKVENDMLQCQIVFSEPSLISDAYNMTLKLILLVDGNEQPLETGSNSSIMFNLIRLASPPNSAEATVESKIETIPDSIDDRNIIHTSTILLICASITIVLVMLYVAQSTRFVSIKTTLFGLIGNDKTKRDLKINGLGANQIGDAKISFRNPHSQNFAESNADSMNGLIKINGSLLSSSDYFKQPVELVDQNQPLIEGVIDSELISILLQEKILIQRNRLTLGHVLGSGQFGRVYKGFLKIDGTGEHAPVAVKTLHTRNLNWGDSVDCKAFLDEGLMMKDFAHENVLALIGVTFDSRGSPMVITPFMKYGDLKSYISDEAASPTVKELIDFGTQIAKGMAYLSGLRFVHRDLAARNCMLDENLTVKVADFGLSRDIYEDDYYSSDNRKTKLPVKWMALESLEKSIYNTKTDVWSYGILLWELMTRGVTPYPDVDNFDIFSYLKEGRRMLRPRYCPVLLYKIMLSCWDELPAKRPTFPELVVSVSKVIDQLKVVKDGQQKVSKDVTYCDVLR